MLRWREWVALDLRRTGCASLQEVMLAQPLPTVPWAFPRERGPIRVREVRQIAASDVDGGLVSPGKSQITDNERALVSCI